MNACGTWPGTTMLPFTSLESRPLMMYSIASVTTRLGTRTSVVMAPLTAPTAAPMAIAITNPDHTGMCCDRNRSPTTNADRPSVDPTDRSMLRVTMTIVSPTPSSAIRDAPTSSCWMLPLLAKLWFLSVVRRNTSRTSARVPASLARRKRAILGIPGACTGAGVWARRAVMPRPSRLARWPRA